MADSGPRRRAVDSARRLRQIAALCVASIKAIEPGDRGCNLHILIVSQAKNWACELASRLGLNYEERETGEGSGGATMSASPTPHPDRKDCHHSCLPVL